jgi:hypothetical protein
MEQISILTSKIKEYESSIKKLTVERNRYEKECFKLIDELNAKRSMLNEIEKIIFKDNKNE